MVPPGLTSNLVAFLDYERARENISEKEVPFSYLLYPASDFLFCMAANSEVEQLS